MRKCLIFLIIGSMLLSFAACGASASKASKKGLSVATQAVELLDNYLDGKENGSFVYEKLDDLCSQMNYTSDYVGTQKTDEQAADYEIHRQLLFASTAVMHDKFNGDAETYENVIEKRNALAVLAGIDER